MRYNKDLHLKTDSQFNLAHKLRNVLNGNQVKETKIEV